MKSVVFVSYSMGIGGVEKALLGVVRKFVAEGWDVDVALIKPSGEFLQYLPKQVRILKVEGFDEAKHLLHEPLRQSIKMSVCNRSYLTAFKLTICLFAQKLQGGAAMLYKLGFKTIPKLNNNQYDLAVAFAGPDAFIDSYVDRCVDAKEKWGWIHFDISKFGIDKSIIRQAYRNFAKINIVSEDGKIIFDKTFPQFREKTVYTPNIIDVESIIEMSGEPVAMPNNDGKRIALTVGRISQEKGQYLALEALKGIIDKGVTDIQWWFVGDGTDMGRCQEYVRIHHLDDYVKFLGARSNPYPFMKTCDIYVQPSQHEGFCITLAEAKLFGKPIIATDFTGAREQLKDYSAHSRVTAYDRVELADAIDSVCRACSMPPRLLRLLS